MSGYINNIIASISFISTHGFAGCQAKYVTSLKGRGITVR
jgi:hypothetical protein